MLIIGRSYWQNSKRTPFEQNVSILNYSKYLISFCCVLTHRSFITKYYERVIEGFLVLWLPYMFGDWFFWPQNVCLVLHFNRKPACNQSGYGAEGVGTILLKSIGVKYWNGRVLWLEALPLNNKKFNSNYFYIIFRYPSWCIALSAKAYITSYT